MRNPRRTASTAAALMIGLALIGFVSIFSASVKASAAAAIERTLRADYAIIPSSFSGSTGFSQDVAKQLRATSNFSSVVEFRQGVLGYKGSARLVMATDPAHVSEVEDLELPSGTLAKLGEGDVLVRKTTAAVLTPRLMCCRIRRTVIPRYSEGSPTLLDSEIPRSTSG